MKDTDNRKKLFCCYFVKLGNIRESALKAGFPPETAMLDGIECMRSPYYRKLISKLYSDLHFSTDAVMSGLERFNVSEIKKVKGGGVEVKFFDRQKAIEKMFEFANSCSSSSIADSFINAITNNNEENSV